MSIFRFILSHDTLGSQVINEPDGWADGKLKLERHQDGHSLVEYFDGGANGSFVFYGTNGDIDGGIDMVRDAEALDGLDADLRMDIAISFDEVNFTDVFNGQVDISAKTEMKDNKLQAPAIRDDFWSKFINRFDTPVDLSSTTDLDGNAVDAVPTITIDLPSQKLRQSFLSYHDEDITHIFTIPNGQYGQVDFYNVVLDEIDEKYQLEMVENPVRPAPLFFTEYAGDYNFNIVVYTATSEILGSATDAELELRLQINDDSPFIFTQAGEGTGGIDGRMKHTFSSVVALNAGDSIRVYIYNNGATPDPYQFVVPANLFYESYMSIVADTVMPATQADGYLLHDAFFGVLQRIGLGNDPFYSEYLGSALTNTRTYDEDGCGWGFAVVKGLQIREYTLAEKPFFASFKHLWEGANPIFNLGFEYTTIGDDQVIRIEPKADFYDSGSTSVDFDNVRDVTCMYDQSRIFKTIKAGFKKWQSEDISGIDDPQTKHTYATRLKKAGTDITLESDFIAASLAFETTRRKTRKKSQDYKFDNDTFILSLNRNDVSPDRYTPELDENFNSIGNLLNPETRYNSVLTPLRSLLRWGNFLNIGLYQYQDSEYKFVSGEGNFDMESDYNCAAGLECSAVICDPLAENQNFDLGSGGYWGALGYLHTPLLFDIDIDMSWEQYLAIKEEPRKAIGVSFTESAHMKFFIQTLEYQVAKGRAKIKAWSYDLLSIPVIETSQRMIECAICERITEDGDTRITEDGFTRILEEC